MAEVTSFQHDRTTKAASLVGSWIAGEQVSGDTRIERENPARPEETVTSIAVADEQTVRSAVREAARAGAAWAAEPVETRSRLVLEAIARLTDLTDEVAVLESREMGKPVRDCARELGSSAGLGRGMAERAPEVLAETHRDDAGRLYVRRRPYGVVAGIVPWNAPLTLAMAKVAPALCAGNSVVIKPSPLAAGAVTRVLSHLASGLPAGLLGVVQGDVATGRHLIGDPLVRRVSFTGGQAAGSAVLAACAARMVPATMELGGNDAAVVLDDIEPTPDLLTRAVTATFRTSGQVCMAAKRWYVHESVFDDFVAGFVAAAEDALRVGDPLDEKVTMGPVITAAARDRVDGLGADAERRGAVRIPIGTVTDEGLVDGPGYFLRPSVVIGAEEDWPVVAEEQFGPIVAILPFRDVDEVVARVNGTEFGLGSSVWSSDEDRAFALARRFDAGYTFVNTHNVDGLARDAPFGGVKSSGFGREFGAEGILEYATTHTMHLPPHARS